MLTSTFDDAASPAGPRTATLEGEDGLFHRLERRDRKPSWIVPAAGVAVVGGVAAAALLLTAPDGRQAAPTEPVASAAPLTGRTLTTTPSTMAATRPLQTASIATSVDPNRPGAAPAATRPAPPRPASRPEPASPVANTESVTSTPAEPAAARPTSTPAQVVAPSGPVIIAPPAAETPVAASPPTASDSAPADALPAATSPPVAPTEPAL